MPNGSKLCTELGFLIFTEVSFVSFPGTCIGW